MNNRKLSMPSCIQLGEEYIETAGSLLEPLFLTYDIERLIGVVANNNYETTPRYISEDMVHKFMRHINTPESYRFRCDIVAAINYLRRITASEINMISSQYSRECVINLRHAATMSIAELNVTPDEEIARLFGQLGM